MSKNKLFFFVIKFQNLVIGNNDGKDNHFFNLLS